MFTGIITDIGTVASVSGESEKTFVLRTSYDVSQIILGASIACDGACLTITQKGADSFTVQASQETLSCTTLGEWKEGRKVNLERAIKVGDELGGHFVSGHVDALTVIDIVETTDGSRIWWLAVPGELIRFIAPKGSVTLDGVSLTANEVRGNSFSVNIIPHTLAHTTFSGKKAGDALNLEIDLVARYLSRLVKS